MNLPIDRSKQAIDLLLVEDNPGDAYLIKEYLEMSGYDESIKISHVESLSASKKYLSTKLPDLIILDLSLPDSSGMKSVEEILGANTKIPLIVITGQKRQNFVWSSLQLGVQDYIHKEELSPELLKKSVFYAIERKNAQLEHENLQLQILQTNKMQALGELASSIAHDFNNNLSVIKGFSEFLRDEYSHEPQIQELVEPILGSTEMAIDLIRRLMDFSRSTSVGKSKLVLNDLISESIQFLKGIIPKSIKIESEIRVNEDLIIFGNQSELQSCILNIAINAKDAINLGGSIKIRLNLEENTPKRLPDNNTKGLRFASIRIQDDGIGMSKSTQSRIFEPFFTTKSTTGGTGLGLANVLNIIKNHDGYIKCNSKIGRGTEFVISLPISEK